MVAAAPRVRVSREEHNRQAISLLHVENPIEWNFKMAQFFFFSKFNTNTPPMPPKVSLYRIVHITQV